MQNRLKGQKVKIMSSLKISSRDYRELIMALPPRPIDNKLEYTATQIQINKIILV